MPHSADDFSRRSHSKYANLSCTCKKSRCLQLYCFCFAASSTCGSSCSCTDCRNTVANASEIMEARNKVLKHSQSIRVLGNSYSQRATAFASTLTAESLTKSHLHPYPFPQTGKITVACKCKKSFCLKKYCICYSGNSFCSPSCSCMNCKNTPDVCRKSPGTNHDDDEANEQGASLPITYRASSPHDQDVVLEAALAMTELMGQSRDASRRETMKASDRLGHTPTTINKRFRMSSQPPSVRDQDGHVKKSRSASPNESVSLQTVESRNPSPVAYKVSPIDHPERPMNDGYPVQSQHQHPCYVDRGHRSPPAPIWTSPGNNYRHHRGQSQHGYYSHDHSSRHHQHLYGRQPQSTSYHHSHYEYRGYPSFPVEYTVRPFPPHQPSSRHILDSESHASTLTTCFGAIPRALDSLHAEYPPLTRSGTDTTLTTTSTASSSSTVVASSMANTDKPQECIVHAGICPSMSDELTVNTGDSAPVSYRRAIPQHTYR